MPSVALFTRAWIEIPNPTDTLLPPYVALFTRAWIEIRMMYSDTYAYQCRPLHEGVD